MTLKFVKRSLPLFVLAIAFITNSAVSSQEDKPVEQVRKNIQALKGLPDSQFMPLMNYFNASLGVRCT
ncbi:MAG: hypothetical protein HOP19_20580, partial [Acidobacteria bacterium]|nr:hypothetical protein [Acidobacteriota bacterium]